MVKSFGIVEALRTAEIHLLQRFFQRFDREGLAVRATDFVCALRGCLSRNLQLRCDAASQTAVAALLEADEQRGAARVLAEERRAWAHPRMAAGHIARRRWYWDRFEAPATPSRLAIEAAARRMNAQFQCPVERLTAAPRSKFDCYITKVPGTCEV